MARLVKGRLERSYELWVWMMTGKRYTITYDVRPLEIVVRGGFIDQPTRREMGVDVPDFGPVLG